MISLFFRNLFFMILHPGVVAGLIPYLILDNRFIKAFAGNFILQHYIGLVIFTAGLVVMLDCIIRFAIFGRGTLSPADPTKKLVVSGYYRYSRNPMYLGVLLILAGEAIFFNSAYLSLYFLLIVLAFNLFIRFFEEPQLTRQFGEEYQEYCRKVNRWF
jgi:protein-S-isoprenylcysteine O-methyltransferase Ste14